MLCFADHTDATATARRARLHDVHVLEVTDLSVDLPPLVILREDVSGWADVEGFTMKSLHSLHISPHIVLSTDGPRACKMVNFLLWIQVLQSTLLEQACPDHVPARARDVSEASHLEGVDNAVVSVSALRHFKARSLVRLQLILGVLDDAIVVLW